MEDTLKYCQEKLWDSEIGQKDYLVASAPFWVTCAFIYIEYFYTYQAIEKW